MVDLVQCIERGSSQHRMFSIIDRYVQNEHLFQILFVVTELDSCINPHDSGVRVEQL